MREVLHPTGHLARGGDQTPVKTIHRRKLSRDYTALPNAMLRDPSLSNGAKGLLAMMLSHAEDWTATLKWLGTQSNDGRKAIRSQLKELEAAGYVIHSIERQNNRFTSIWIWHDTTQNKTIPVDPLVHARTGTISERTVKKRKRQFPPVPDGVEP
jgi:hypothetical protein